MAERPEFLLHQEKVVVPHWAGCGVQFNQHVFAPITGVREERFADLEQKLGVLSPQLVRIFYSDADEGTPADGDHQTGTQQLKWDSFVRTVTLADRVAATINVTWQSGREFFLTPQGRERAMSRFADVLDRLVTTSGVSKLDWVTIQNEPNTKPAPGTTKAVTPERLADMYQRLHEKLVAKGLRQIRLMGGDLIEGDSHPESPLHHSRWFEFMSKHYADILGAYSAHIYWDYQTPDRFQFRLKDTHDIVAGLTNRKPLYITEYGIRSADRNRLVNGKKPIDPGNFKDGTSLGRTNIAAFQQAWFQIRAAQMGYAGVIKWDGYFGKYDRGTSAYYAIGPPGADGWEPYPMSFLLRLFTTTTETGWRVLSIEQSKSSPATKQLTAFGGPAGELTIIGLDSRGASENKAVKDKISYTIGGLPPHTSFALVLWNRAGGGHVVVDSTITTGAERVKTIEVPLHSVFALTTKTLPPL